MYMSEQRWPLPHTQGAQDVVRRAANRLREDGRHGAEAGLRPEDARALAALLDILATELPHVARDVQTQTVEWCRELLGGQRLEPP
jgi:hypothetical protein